MEIVKPPRPANKKTPKRKSFRHGDLRRVMLEVALDLARQGGPEAVSLRQVTRRAGVVPNAAYRHFANQKELLQAVRSAAIQSLAIAIEQEMAAVKVGRNKAAFGRRRVYEPLA